MIHKRIDFVPTRANIQPRRTKRRSKRGIKLEIERNGNHRRRDGRFGHVCAFNVRLFVQWPYPKLVGITRRHGSKQGRRIGVESRVLSLINKARGLGCHLFSLSLSLSCSLALAGNCLHRSLSFHSLRPRSSTIFVHPFILELLARMLRPVYRIL